MLPRVRMLLKPFCLIYTCVNLPVTSVNLDTSLVVAVMIFFYFCSFRMNQQGEVSVLFIFFFVFIIIFFFFFFFFYGVGDVVINCYVSENARGAINCLDLLELIYLSMLFELDRLLCNDFSSKSNFNELQLFLYSSFK